jgi:hypothetical protein
MEVEWVGLTISSASSSSASTFFKLDFFCSTDHEEISVSAYDPKAVLRKLANRTYLQTNP